MPTTLTITHIESGDVAMSREYTSRDIAIEEMAKFLLAVTPFHVHLNLVRSGKDEVTVYMIRNRPGKSKRARATIERMKMYQCTFSSASSLAGVTS